MARVLLLLALLVPVAHAQRATVSGTVLDAATGEPLPGASVYLTGTTAGDATDSRGDYSFETAIQGDVIVTASMVGYSAQERSLRIRDGGTVEASFRLSPSTVALEDVTVQQTAEQRAADREWRNQLARFRFLFLGRTRVARETQIANPAVLTFSESNGRLFAQAESRLRTVSPRLGYNVLWDNLSLAGSEARRTWSGSNQFVVMSGTEDQERGWERAREAAYRGSFRHFMDALRTSSVEDSRFEVFPVDRPGLIPRFATALEGETIATSMEPRAGRIWLVMYHDERADRAGRIELQRNVDWAQMGSGRSQWSWVEIGPRGFVFGPDGRLENPLDHVLRGYWDYERAAELLPADYVPPRDLMPSG
ncbi:carboxypeptidase-like regulatory domain-containing protein [Rubrivirga sp.]|uniref:carboxypeptidase-like regulatory domain-containing protein n=1 Tax=Rubrivirga sp. TaxID=1885344 RepID=UPI003C7223B4